MKRELHEKYEKLKKKGSNPGHNPVSLQNCIDVRVTEDENIEITFKDIPTCEVVKDEYRKVLQAALMGGETIYKTFLREVPKPRMPE